MKVTDDFSDARRPGRVRGTSSPSGQPRLVVDAENRVSIDHGALRFEPLDCDGWERQGIAYGPYPRKPGLAFAVALLNGHNTSESGHIGEAYVRRLKTWLRAGSIAPTRERAAQWLLHGRHLRTLREFKRWYLRRPEAYDGDLRENLAVGWFDASTPEAPHLEGDAFVVHATGAENGELWVRSGNNTLPTIRGLQNVPLLYVVVLRPTGATYYVASNVKAHGTALTPHMRPVALTTRGLDAPELYAGVHQSVLGQIGFRVDSRVYGTQIQQLKAADQWFGLASCADSLRGEGPLSGSPVEHHLPGSGDTDVPSLADGDPTPQLFQVETGEFVRTETGVQASHGPAFCWFDTRQAVGLVHLEVDVADGADEVGIVWRADSARDYFAVHFGPKGCRLEINRGGRTELVREDFARKLVRQRTHSVLVVDDGSELNVFLDGARLFDGAVQDERLGRSTSVGLTSARGGTTTFRNLEVHPRQVPIPEELHLPLPLVRSGTNPRIDDSFEGSPGDLSAHVCPSGGAWRREMGRGRFELVPGSGLKVKADREHPNPGRTAYTQPWSNLDFAELSIRVTPPGHGRGEGESGRAGVIFMQDPRNFIIVSTWLSDDYDGSSISSFFTLRGFEQLYDAVWSNVGRKVHWGKPYDLRVAFDGSAFCVYLDDEAVLYRALTDVCPRAKPLTIRRVGIVANWEWGDDTGSVFHHFRARA